MALRILSNTRASGQSLTAGRVYRVPEDVSERDAKILLRIRKAETVPDEPAPKRRKVSANAD